MTETITSYMQRLDALWAEAEPIARDLIGSGDQERQRQGQRLLDYWDAWRELTIQSGLTEIEELTKEEAATRPEPCCTKTVWCKRDEGHTGYCLTLSGNDYPGRWKVRR